MNQLDVYYRALLNYRQQTVANNECSALRSAIAEADAEQDKIVITRVFCTIEEDWVDAIEAGLIHIEKAIKEDRQFIRSNGEVVPIEKVKHVSKETVEHLAKHSNLITRYEEGKDIIPDKLYTVERLNDYAVYENRFLYMLLCYLRDFVTLRYNNILDLTNKYDATVDFNKRIHTGKQSVNYTLSMHDIRRDDPYLKEHNPARDTIDRIDLILKSILAFLATPLMEIVAKAPMLKPPITKTNVLKMNNNFKGAVALYDYIISYDKPGYVTETEVNTLSPFRDDLADEMAEAGGLVSFLAYEYGLGIKQELKDAYLREEDRLKAEEIKKRAERIATLKRRLEASGEGIEDYVITLEKQLRALEGESARAEALAEQIVLHEKKEKSLERKIDSLSKEIEGLRNDIEEERVRHFEELERLKAEHEDAMHELIVKHENYVRELNERHTKAIIELNDRHALQIRELNEKHAAELEAMRNAAAEAEMRHAAAIEKMRADTEEAISEARAACDKAVASATEEREQCQAALVKKCAEYNALVEEKRLAEARIKALGGVNRDYTDRDSFNELENEYHAFVRIYKEQWAKTKKQIRKNHLNIENFKGQKEKDKNSD